MTRAALATRPVTHRDERIVHGRPAPKARPAATDAGRPPTPTAASTAPATFVALDRAALTEPTAIVVAMDCDLDRILFPVEPFVNGISSLYRRSLNGSWRMRHFPSTELLRAELVIRGWNHAQIDRCFDGALFGMHRAWRRRWTDIAARADREGFGELAKQIRRIIGSAKARAAR